MIISVMSVSDVIIYISLLYNNIIYYHIYIIYYYIYNNIYNNDKLLIGNDVVQS